MLARVASDLHVEFWDHNKIDRMVDVVIPPMDNDHKTVLLLPGDVGLFYKYNSTMKNVFKALSKRFRAIFYVYGNHEWYHSDVWGNEKEFWSDKKLPDNVFVLDNDYIILDDIVFIGLTLFTSFDNRDPLAMIHAKKAMSDFEVIRKPNLIGGPYTSSTIRIDPEDTVERHDKAVAFLKSALNIFRGTNNIVVLSHHAPSAQSVPERFRGDLLNAAYYTELSGLIHDGCPVLWVHGHTHDFFHYNIDGCTVICNPYGYHAQDVNKHYQPRTIISIDDKPGDVSGYIEELVDDSEGIL